MASAPWVGLEVASDWEHEQTGLMNLNVVGKQKPYFGEPINYEHIAEFCQSPRRALSYMFGSSSPVLTLRQPQARGTHIWVQVLPFKYQHRPRARATQPLPITTHPLFLDGQGQISIPHSRPLLGPRLWTQCSDLRLPWAQHLHLPPTCCQVNPTDLERK